VEQGHITLQRETNMAKRAASHYSEIGCCIPKDYFWVIGWGESGVGIETDSYDAGRIKNYSVALYSSVLPTAYRAGSSAGHSSQFRT
jgi:hypothetical protein